MKWTSNTLNLTTFHVTHSTAMIVVCYRLDELAVFRVHSWTQPDAPQKLLSTRTDCMSSASLCRWVFCHHASTAKTLLQVWSWFPKHQHLYMISYFPYCQAETNRVNDPTIENDSVYSQKTYPGEQQKSSFVIQLSPILSLKSRLFSRYLQLSRCSSIGWVFIMITHHRQVSLTNQLTIMNIHELSYGH